MDGWPRAHPAPLPPSTPGSRSCLEDVSLITMQKATLQLPNYFFFFLPYICRGTAVDSPKAISCWQTPDRPAQASWSCPAPRTPATRPTCHDPSPPRRRSRPVTSEETGGTSCLLRLPSTDTPDVQTDNRSQCRIQIYDCIKSASGEKY